MWSPFPSPPIPPAFDAVAEILDPILTPVWRISDVRYWGFPSDTWHLDFARDADLPEQLANLARTLPMRLAHRV